MDTEHHRDLAREFPDLRHRIHELKLASARFRDLYEEYREVDDEVCRIERDIETPSDEYTGALKRRRVRLKDRLYGMLTGRLPVEAPSDEYVLGLPARITPRGVRSPRGAPRSAGWPRAEASSGTGR